MLETKVGSELNLDIENETSALSTKGQKVRHNRTAKKEVEMMNFNEQNNRKREGIKISTFFTKKGVHPFNEVKWEYRKASIKNDKGEVIYEEENVEVPASWSMLATNIVASKYFYGGRGTNVREKSVRQLIHRVARTIADWGLNDGYFASKEDADVFYNELCFICVNQYAAFNSPVWFNVGLHQTYGITADGRSSYAWNKQKGAAEKVDDAYKRPQASACFIQAVNDSMEDIMRLATSEAMLFKYGSGTGTDLSTIRSSKEKLSGGGSPSGPISFMRVFDQVAAVIKSGGKTRRAAKMQSLKVDHPDIMDFIRCKVHEEKKARALIRAGYDGSLNGEAYSSVMFQNANLSVRVSDEFMKAVEAGTVWHTKAVTTGKIVDVLDARTIMKEIAQSAYECGDPGVQYDTTINRWHTCPNSGRINASNPCSEYMFVDNSACNLASINLMKFIGEEKLFDYRAFQHVVRIMIIAQDILVDNGSYPTPEITTNSHLFRPLGLGYANLGAMLMALGKPYDSDEGRSLASLITSLLTGYAYSTSSDLAGTLGTFDEYEKNREPMLGVINMHRSALERLPRYEWLSELQQEANSIWDSVLESGRKVGFRNAQVTVLAPTGTIGFMMDCDTTGVEPDIALVKYKQMADGGMFKLVNRTIPMALSKLGYSDVEISEIIKYIDEHDTIEGAPHLKEEHLNVFDCAFKPQNGVRFIDYHAHLKMMAAVQPFLSGAISKTINMPATATPEEIYQVFMDGWKMGLKAVAIYRDGSKGIQPLSTSKDKKESKMEEDASDAVVATPKPYRRRMPATRQSITHKFEVAGHQGYLTVGLYEDGTPGELFITMAKEGSTVGGIMDAFGTAISMCLQYGVPLSTLIDKFSHSRFEPSGFTKNPEIPFAKSLVDYIFRWMDLMFGEGKKVKLAQPRLSSSENESMEKSNVVESKSKETQLKKETGGASAAYVAPGGVFENQVDAPACDNCGAITVRNGSCYRCYVCGNSMGCS